MRKLTAFLTIAFSVFSLSVVALPTAPAYAASASKQSACDALTQLQGDQDCGSDASKNVISGTVSTIVNVLSLILGAVAIVMIIVGGFRFVASGGDSNKVAGARGTIIYALVGLVVASLAQFIVHFVLERV